MAKVNRFTVKFSTGCLVLFALPFAAVGVGMGIWLLSPILVYFDAQSWTEVPARILRTELESHQGEDATTYQVTAEYVYEYDGRKYKGTRVGLSSQADNLGSFQQDAYRELSGYKKSKRPFRCFVNPAQPEQSLLYRNLRWEMTAFMTLFVLAFGGVGFGLLIAGLVGHRRQRANTALATASPDSPWMWKADWAAGRILSSSKKTMIGLLLFALFWNVVSAPLWLVLPGEILDKGNRFALLGLLFPLVGALLVLGAMISVSRWRKFGQSVFQMAAVPGVIGGQLAGVIRTSAKIRPEDGFHLKLLCIRRITTGSGDDRSTTEETVWDDQQIITRELLDEGAEESAIPVVFQIPYECRATNDSNADDQTLWRLTATAKVPGLDYAATFEVPVFKTPESDPNFVAGDRTPAEYAALADPQRDLREAGVIKTASPDGEGCRFVFPMARNLGSAGFVTVFWLIWTGVIVFMWRTGAPVFFPIVFGLFDILIFLILVDLWFYRSAVDVSPRGLTITGGLFGFGSARRIETADIQKIECKRSMSSGQQVYFNIVVNANGKHFTLGKRVCGQHLTTAIIRQIEQARSDLGRRGPAR